MWKPITEYKKEYGEVFVKVGIHIYIAFQPCDSDGWFTSYPHGKLRTCSPTEFLLTENV